MAANCVETLGDTAEAGAGYSLPVPGVAQDLGGGGGKVVEVDFKAASILAKACSSFIRNTCQAIKAKGTASVST